MGNVIISIDILLYRIISKLYCRILLIICKYRIAGYEKRYRIVTNHPIYTPK